MRVAAKFESLLDRYRRPDGSRWNGQELHEATGGVVTRSYVSMLRKGHISNPGVEKLSAIAKVMGFPPELWFGIAGNGLEPAASNGGDASIAERTRRLFEVVTDEKTGEPYADAEVARMSYGDLTEEEVEGIRSGRIENPTVAQVVALSDVFGVDPSLFLGAGKKPALLDRETVAALGDEKSRAIANKSVGLSDGEKDLVIDMIERLGRLHDASDPA